MLLSRSSRKLLLQQRSIGSRQNNPSMADFGYITNTIRHQSVFTPIVYINVADTGMVPLTDESLLCKKKSEK